MPTSGAEGELGEGRSFHFYGPDGGLSLRAQNLSLFLDQRAPDSELRFFSYRENADTMTAQRQAEL